MQREWIPRGWRVKRALCVKEVNNNNVQYCSHAFFSDRYVTIRFYHNIFLSMRSSDIRHRPAGTSSPPAARTPPIAVSYQHSLIILLLILLLFWWAEGAARGHPVRFSRAVVILFNRPYRLQVLDARLSYFFTRYILISECAQAATFRYSVRPLFPNGTFSRRGARVYKFGSTAGVS